MQKNTQWQVRVSPTLGDLEDTHQNIWGTIPYPNTKDGIVNDDFNELPTVFFGCYGLPDFWRVYRHGGKKAILWAGTDILHLKNHYWLEEGGGIRVDNKGICEWLDKYVENWVENESECNELKKLGIKSKICPSFLGDVNKFEVSFKPGNKLYTSVSGDDFERYRWWRAFALADENPKIEFHFYGNTKEMISSLNNVVIHGRVSKEQMNEEIKKMQGCLRLIEIEGFSEIVAKAMLMGQYPVSAIEYPHTLKVSEVGKILEIKEPNLKGRKWVLKIINQYPWNAKITTNN